MVWSTTRIICFKLGFNLFTIVAYEQWHERCHFLRCQSTSNDPFAWTRFCTEQNKPQCLGFLSQRLTMLYGKSSTRFFHNASRVTRSDTFATNNSAWVQIHSGASGPVVLWGNIAISAINIGDKWQSPERLLACGPCGQCCDPPS